VDGLRAGKKGKVAVLPQDLRPWWRYKNLENPGKPRIQCLPGSARYGFYEL
jgi:hypothetical protein